MRSTAPRRSSRSNPPTAFAKRRARTAPPSARSSSRSRAWTGRGERHLLVPKGEMALEAVREAVTGVSRVDWHALIVAMPAGDAGKVARVVESLKAEGEPLPLLLWTLAEELRKVMAMVAGQRPRGWLPPERAEALAKIARRHDRASIDRELLRAHHI